ncbi:hypothetical protein D3C75_667080 [compost metagenome]
MADSSRSLGIPRINWISRNTKKVPPVPAATRWGMTKGRYVFTQPSWWNMAYWGIISTCPGIIRVIIRMENQNFFKGKSRRAKPKATRVVDSRVTSRTMASKVKVFR